MAYENTWKNADGLEIPFGPITADNLFAGGQHTVGKVKQIQMDVDVVAGLNSVGTALSVKHQAIPAGAYIVAAYYESEVDFDQAVEFGTADIAGVALDQDGLIATGTTTAKGAGALIDTVVAEDSYIVVTATVTPPTAGSGSLVVEYIL